MIFIVRNYVDLLIKARIVYFIYDTYVKNKCQSFEKRN